MSKRGVIATFVLCLIFLAVAPDVGAFFWDDWISQGKKLIQPLVAPYLPPTRGPVTATSDISLASGGDLNQNGQIDSGDTVTFTYVLTNPTDSEYSFATLQTKIPRDNLHFIHDIRGTASLFDRDGTIIIPNLRLGPKQKLTISFNARINYLANNDTLITTAPELILYNPRLFLNLPDSMREHAVTWPSFA